MAQRKAGKGLLPAHSSHRWHFRGTGWTSPVCIQVTTKKRDRPIQQNTAAWAGFQDIVFVQTVCYYVIRKVGSSQTLSFGLRKD